MLRQLRQKRGCFACKCVHVCMYASLLRMATNQVVCSGGSNSSEEGTVMTDKDIACIKVEGSGNATGRVVGASVGVQAAPAISNVPIVGWLLAGLVTMVAQDKGSEIGGDVARNYNDC